MRVCVHTCIRAYVHVCARFPLLHLRGPCDLYGSGTSTSVCVGGGGGGMHAYVCMHASMMCTCISVCILAIRPVAYIPLHCVNILGIVVIFGGIVVAVSVPAATGSQAEP